MKRRPFALGFILCLLGAFAPLALFVVLNPAHSNPLTEIASRVAREYDRLLQLRMQQTFALAALPSLRAFAASTPETRSQRAAVALNELQALVAADKNIRQALIVDSNGTIIMSTLDGWGGALTSRQFIRDALSGQLAVSAVSRDGGENSIFYAAPIFNNAAEIAGALALRVDAQEIWNIAPRGEKWHAVLSDENGVRLDDTGDTARRLSSFGALDAARAAQIANAQIYGAEALAPRATNLPRAQRLITQGALDQLQASDFDARAFAAQRLVSKPWYALILAPQPAFAENLAMFAIPALAAILFAFGGALVASRL